MLEFEHRIELEVHHDSSPFTITVLVNDSIKLNKDFIAGTHIDEIIFSHLYDDGGKNNLSIQYNGDQEAQKKYIKVKRIGINNVNLNIFNANYVPKIDQTWWDSLDKQTQQGFKDSIHGNNGNNFGWFGDISWTYFTGKNKISKMKVRTSADYDNTDDILGMKMEWIYEDNTQNNAWELND